jgi:hypothetical protein
MPSDKEHNDDTSVLGKRALEAEEAPAVKEDESGKESPPHSHQSINFTPLFRHDLKQDN